MGGNGERLPIAITVQKADKWLESRLRNIFALRQDLLLSDERRLADLNVSSRSGQSSGLTLLIITMQHGNLDRAQTAAPQTHASITRARTHTYTHTTRSNSFCGCQTDTVENVEANKVLF